jgi:hypothetical protein
MAVGLALAVSGCGEANPATPVPWPSDPPTEVAQLVIDWVPYQSFAEAAAQAAHILVADFESASSAVVAPTGLTPDDPAFTDPMLNPYYDPEVPGSGYPPPGVLGSGELHTYSLMRVVETLKGDHRPGDQITFVQGGGVMGQDSQRWPDVDYPPDSAHRRFLVLTTPGDKVLHSQPPIAPAYGIWVVQDNQVWPLALGDAPTTIGTPTLAMTDPAWYPSTLDDIRALLAAQ